MSMEGAGAFGSGPFLFSGEVQSNLKRVFRRCSAMLLVALLAVGVFSVPASAAETSYKPSGFWDIYFRSQNPVYSLYRAVQTFLESLGKDPETATDEDWQIAYNQYTDDLETKYGSSIFSSEGGFWISGSLTSVRKGGTGTLSNIELISPSSFSCFANSGTYTNNSCSVSCDFVFNYNGELPQGMIYLGTPYVSSYLYSDPTFGVPSLQFSAMVLSPGGTGKYVTADGLSISSGYTFSSDTSRTYLKAKLGSSIAQCQSNIFLTLDLSRLIYVVPFTAPEIIVDIESRVGYLTNNYIYVEGDTNIVVENVQIVNETTNVYYNPVTGVSTPIINWQYDYGDRSYNLTLEGGLVVKVVFGPETVQINEGDTVYNVQYAVPDSGGGGEVDPTPTPTPPPDPDDGKDYTGILGSIWEALKGIWESIKGLGQSIIDGIIGGLQSLFLPSEESLNSFSGEVDEKLPIINDVQELGDQFVAAIENPAQAVNDLRMTTVVDLGQGGGQITGNAQINLLDVSWYLEYKPLVDDVIVGFVWLVFLWNLFGQLPNIIHGGASALHTTSELQRAQDDAARDWAKKRWG